MEKCKRWVADGTWGGGSCLKDATVEVDGELLCPRHAAGKRRSKKADAERDAARNEDKARCEEARLRCRELGFGRPDYVGFGKGGYTGGVSLSPEEADALIDRLERSVR